jgi:adenylate cyclase
VVSVLIASLIAFLAVQGLPELRQLEKGAGDGIERITTPLADTDDRVILVAIDEATLAGLPYREPVDRSVLAHLIQVLVAKGAAVIGLDVLLDSQSEPEKDHALRQAFAAAGQTRIITAYAPPALLQLGATADVAAERVAVLNWFNEATTPGDIQILVDNDNRVSRWIPYQSGQNSFAAAIAAAAGARTVTGPQRLTYRLPLNIPDGRAASCAAVSAKRFPCFSARMLLDNGPMLPAQWFAGKVVLLGADLHGRDRHYMIGSALLGLQASELPGFELQAHAVSQLLHGWSVTDVGWTTVLGLTILAAAAALLVMAWEIATGWRVAIVVAFALAYVAATGLSINLADTRLPIVSPLLALTLAAGWSGWRRWQAQRERSQWLRFAFSRYVSPALVDRLAAEPDLLALGGERVEVSCIFTDIQGFTSLSEAMPPDALVALLNRYLDGMSTLFFEHGATVDKFVGDAVVGFVGAPIAQADHAAVALTLARALDRFAENFRREAQASGIAFGMTRIGINSGPVTVGNFGGADFFDYTAIGDTVNTAARLEGANSFFGTRVCAAQSTVDHAQDGACRQIGAVSVKGRAEPLQLYEVLALDAPELAYRSTYHSALNEIGQQTAAAHAAFATLAESYPTDPLIRYHLKRCEQGSIDPVIRLEEKSQ